jgi:hypothetical protein
MSNQLLAVWPAISKDVARTSHEWSAAGITSARHNALFTVAQWRALIYDGYLPRSLLPSGVNRPSSVIRYESVCTLIDWLRPEWPLPKLDPRR